EMRCHWVMAIRATVIGLTVSYGASVMGHFVTVELHRHRVIDISAFPQFIPWILISFLSGGISGWVVGLLHRKHRNSMLLIFAVAQFVWASMLRSIFLIEADTRRFLALAFTY